jgi:hypothetical protein
VTRRATPALVLALLLVVAGCGGDDDTAAEPSSPAPASSTASSAPASPTPSETAFAGTEIEVAVRDGRVDPPTRRVEVAEGEQVRLLITSDTADELHVHGFDIEQDLPAGQQVTVDFTADQTGVFEIETHESGLQLVQLEVR